MTSRGVHPPLHPVDAAVMVARANRRIDSTVWCFVGNGEMDEPERYSLDGRRVHPRHEVVGEIACEEVVPPRDPESSPVPTSGCTSSAPEPALRDLLADVADLRRLRRGGHDPRRVQIKGWALGPAFEARNDTHQMKKMSEAELTTFRDRLEPPMPRCAGTVGALQVSHPPMDLPRGRKVWFKPNCQTSFAHVFTHGSAPRGARRSPPRDARWSGRWPG